MTKRYNTEAIRKLLNQSFSAEQFDSFCYDKFKHIYNQFSAAMTKTLRIHLLIEHCDRHGQLPNLLDLIKEKNPYQYEKYATQASSLYQSGLIEFKSVRPLSLDQLTPEQKMGLAIAFQETLASFLGCPTEEIEIVSMEAGSIKITVRLPLESLDSLMRMAEHIEEKLGFSPTSLLDNQMTSSLLSPKTKLSVEKPDTPTLSFTDMYHEIPLPIINIGNQPVNPFTALQPTNRNYNWYRVLNRHGDFLPQIHEDIWLLVDSHRSASFESDDLIVFAGEDSKGSISVQSYSQTLPFQGIYLGIVRPTTRFSRDVNTGRVTFLVETGMGMFQIENIIGVVVGFWLNPFEISSTI